MKNYKAFIILFICVVYAGSSASAGELDRQHYGYGPSGVVGLLAVVVVVMLAADHM